MEAMRKNCRTEYQPHQNCSVDEAMIAFRGRLAFRQYNPAKPTKYGIKVWVRADPTNGYLNDYQIYTGKVEGGPEEGLSTRVVKDMVESITGRNHIVNMDNFFSSPTLFGELLSADTYARGTVRCNRKQFPKDSLHKSCVKEQGDTKVLQKGPLVAVAWKDKKTVHFLTSADDATAPPVYVERKRRDGTRRNVPCPAVVREYNTFMNGVDRADQIRTEYPTYRNSKKWWHYLFWFVFDLGIANAFICMKESVAHQLKTRTGREKFITQLNFRKELAKSLVGGVRISRKRKLSALDPRGDREAHLPVTTTKGRCRECSKTGLRKESRVKCQGCGYNLCIDCFVPHHR